MPPTIQNSHPDLVSPMDKDPPFIPSPPSNGHTINDILPPELLSLIFEWNETIERQGDDETYERLGLEAPIIVSHVCAKWRQVAIDTPRLWNLITVNDNTPVSRIETWLHRSKAYPLHIDVSLTESRLPVIELLAQHIERWKEVSFETGVAAHMNGMLEFMRGKKAPALTKFFVNDGLSDEFEEDFMSLGIALLDSSSSAPCLKEVSLWSACLDWSRHPFSNLRILEVAYLPHNTKPTLAEVTALLESCPSLTKLAICNGFVRPADTEPTYQTDHTPRIASVTLASLEELILTDFDSPDILNFHLKFIHAPNIHSFTISDMHSDADGEPVDFSSSMELIAEGQGPPRSLAKIQYIKLGAINCRSSDAFENVFCGLMELKRLHFYVGSVDEDPEEPIDHRELIAHYLRAFIPRKIREDNNLPVLSIPEACPLLEEVYFSGFGEQPILGLVLHRTTRLKKVFYNSRDELTPLLLNMCKTYDIQVEEYSDSEFEDDEDYEDDYEDMDGNHVDD